MSLSNVKSFGKTVYLSVMLQFAHLGISLKYIRTGISCELYVTVCKKKLEKSELKIKATDFLLADYDYRKWLLDVIGT